MIMFNDENKNKENQDDYISFDTVSKDDGNMHNGTDMGSNTTQGQDGYNTIYSGDHNSFNQPYQTQSSNNNSNYDKSANYQYDNGQWHYSTPNETPPPKNSGNGGMKALAIVMTVAFVLVTSGFGFYVAYNSGFLTNKGNQAETTIASSSQTQENKDEKPDDTDTGLKVEDVPILNPSNVSDEPLSAKAIYKKVSPSVVGIISYASVEGGDYQPISQGTGIIFSTDGYIITNSHVVEDGKLKGKYQVVLKDKTEYDATLVGYDVKTDLAVIKIEATNLPAAEFGNSDQVEVGEDVIAIGNPYDLEFAGTTTRGIISGVDTTINVGTSNYTMKTLQTDAAINPGNSGGPLINEYGQVIGINSAKIASQDIEGMGFAIPINTAKPVVDNLVRYGYVKDRVRIGITFTPVNSMLAQLNDIPVGLRVVEIDHKTDAYKKGVTPGDIIYAIDGKEVTGYKNIREIFEDKKPGDTAVLSVFRVTEKSQTKMDITIILEEDIPNK